MENVADALKMAAAVLIFIIAVASAFSIFGQAKQTADAIIGMRDKQKYLEAPEVDNGILYTSASSISSGNIEGITTNGDRLVSMADVFSTIQRYHKEKYGVTLVKEDGTVIARYDSSTESIMSQYNNIIAGLDDHIEKLNRNTKTDYATPIFTEGILKKLYKIRVDGNDKITCGAPWYGNDKEIQKRIIADISGKEYTYNRQTYNNIAGYQKNLLNTLNGKKIIEVTNEIDQSAYLTTKDESDENITTNLLQQYEMPTVEIIYIIS